VTERAFPVAAAHVWKSLPDLVTSAPSGPGLKLTCLTFPTPVIVQCLCTDSSCFGHYNRSCFITYNTKQKLFIIVTYLVGADMKPQRVWMSIHHLVDHLCYHLQRIWRHKNTQAQLWLSRLKSASRDISRLVSQCLGLEHLCPHSQNFLGKKLGRFLILGQFLMILTNSRFNNNVT